MSDQAIYVKNEQLAGLMVRWQAGRDTITVLDTGHAVVSVSKDARGSYHCLRYFPVDGVRAGDQWDVSSDLTGVSAEASIAWLAVVAQQVISEHRKAGKALRA